MASSFILIFVLMINFSSLITSTTIYDVTDYGAKPDMQTDAAKSFLQAWNAACSSTGQSIVHVPKGSTFLIGHVTFSGPCKSQSITIKIDGTLIAPSNYEGFGKRSNWIVFDRTDGLTVIGGRIDGRGASLWSCKAKGNNCPDGATSLTFHNSNNIVIDSLTSINSQLYYIVIDMCQAVTVRGVKITAAGNSPNTDGIHVEESTGVTITGTSMKTGDDCISIGPGTTNMWIQQVTCGPGHGISIGSLGKEGEEEGVKNVTVKTATFIGSANGLRIKSWARPSNSYVNDVTFDDVIMQNVKNPLIIDQHYCPHNTNCPGQSSGVKISGITYNNIRGSSASPVAVNFDCSSSNPCTGVELHNVDLTYQSEPAKYIYNYVIV